ncbi:MAG: ribosome maturation factor RimM [Bacteroidia bacterium]|nr:ribosome maturation factor RimM [Bacteroidia bacterium]
MLREDCVELGYIGKPHGLKGEVKAHFDVHDMSEYAQRKSFYLGKKGAPLEKYKLKRMGLVGQQAIMKFEGINYRDEAEALRTSTIYFPIAELPKLEEGQFYYYQVIGFEVEDKKLGRLGTVKDIMETSGQDILIMDYKEKEILIPMTESFVLHAEHENKLIHTNIPDGLVEFYLGKEEEDGKED